MSKTKDLEKIISDAEELGIVNPTKVRNLEIRRKYKRMREKEFMNYDDTIIKLAEEYCRSISTIIKIVVGCRDNDY